MDANTHASAHSPFPCGGGCAAQLAWFGLEDPLWFPTLLEHLNRGGVIVIERTGDLLLMPGVREHDGP